MTIKELEEKTGLARANIRYYEQQGLVHPARQENGYRDYSGEDLQTLRKIKLLRHLGLGIETIRTVQRGEQTLEEALAAREEELEKEAAMLGKEKTVCRELRQRRVAYDALEPETYLLELERQEAAARGALAVPRPEKKDLIQSVYYPWRRFFARYFDWSVYSFLWAIVWVGIFRISDTGIGTTVLSWLVTLILMVLIEPLLLSCFGTTPGKAIFGLHVSAVGGGALTYGDASRWTRGALYSGEGLNIPLVNLWCNWKSYRRCRAGEAQPWEEDINYTIDDTCSWRGVLFVALEALLVAMIILLALRALAPPCYGDLSREDYIKNANHMARQTKYGMYMDENGNWTLPLSATGSLSWSDTSRAIPHILTDEGGSVTGITLSYTADEAGFITDLPTQMMIAYGALSARDSGPLGFGYIRALNRYAAAEIDLSQSGSDRCGSVLLEWDVDRRGFELWDNIWLTPTEEGGEDPLYTCTVTMTYDS